MKNLILPFLALSLSTAAAAAPLTKSQVRGLVQPTEGTVASCASTAGVHGTLRVTFKVNADGSVSNFKAKAPHAGDAAAKCAEDAITGIKFPESSNGRQSKYRFQLGGAGSGISDALKGADFSGCGKGAKGSVRAKWTIGADGSATGVTVKGKHAKDDVGSCVSDVLGKTHFPTQSKPQTVERTIKL